MRRKRTKPKATPYSDAILGALDFIRSRGACPDMLVVSWHDWALYLEHGLLGSAPMPRKEAIQIAREEFKRQHGEYPEDCEPGRINFFVPEEKDA